MHTQPSREGQRVERWHTERSSRDRPDRQTTEDGTRKREERKRRLEMHKGGNAAEGDKLERQSSEPFNCWNVKVLE